MGIRDIHWGVVSSRFIQCMYICAVSSSFGNYWTFGNFLMRKIPPSCHAFRKQVLGINEYQFLLKTFYYFAGCLSLDEWWETSSVPRDAVSMPAWLLEPVSRDCWHHHPCMCYTAQSSQDPVPCYRTLGHRPWGSAQPTYYLVNSVRNGRWWSCPWK